MFEVIALNLQVGHVYKNGSGEEVKIMTTLNKNNPDYRDGFRFVCNRGRTYTPRGKWTTDKKPTTNDLISRIR